MSGTEDQETKKKHTHKNRLFYAKKCCRIKTKKKAHASLDFSKSSDEKQVSNLERLYELYLHTIKKILSSNNYSSK